MYLYFSIFLSFSKLKEMTERPKPKLVRSDSLPELHIETLLEEMGIEDAPPRAGSSFQIRTVDKKQPDVQTARTVSRIKVSPVFLLAYMYV